MLLVKTRNVKCTVLFKFRQNLKIVSLFCSFEVLHCLAKHMINRVLLESEEEQFQLLLFLFITYCLQLHKYIHNHSCNNYFLIIYVLEYR